MELIRDHYDAVETKLGYKTQQLEDTVTKTRLPDNDHYQVSLSGRSQRSHYQVSSSGRSQRDLQHWQS